MPFALSNAPAGFQAYGNKILAENLDIFIIMYLNNILINTEDTNQGHVDIIWWALKILRKYGLYANLKKCHFH